MENIHEIYLSSDLAEELTNIGFDWNDFLTTKSLDKPFQWNIPLHIAQKWLRDVKHYHVDAYLYFYLKDFRDFNHDRYSVTIIGPDVLKMENVFDEPKLYKTYEKALEAGIKKAINFILEEEKI